MSYKDSISLPKTSFSMKGNLIRREPAMLKAWDEQDIEGRLREAGKGRPRFVLHDGPPYANGHVHLGTALNKILKDFIVKSHTMMGYDSPYVPGWDCHGMPIEHKVVSAAEGEDLTRAEVRRRCREYALRYVDVQREEFRRLGVFGQWQRPYLTMSRSYEAGIVRAFGRMAGKGYVYLGLRPIHWCTSCSTALADAEVEYADHSSPSIYVAFDPADPDRWRERGVPEGARVVIWTTTPWTLPANRAVALHPSARYVVAETAEYGRLLVAADRAEAFLEDAGLEGGVSESPAFTGAELAGLELQHPLDDDVRSKVVTAEHVTMDDGTGCVHTAPGHGAEDFMIAPEHGLEVFSPVDGDGRFTGAAGPYAGLHVFEANPRITEDLRDSGHLLASRSITHSYPHCWRCKSPLIFRATEQFFLDLDCHGLKDRVLDMVEEVSWHPAWGHERMRNMMESRPDWCLSRQRAWGVALPAFLCRDCGSPVLDPEVIDAVADLVEEEGSDVWFDRTPEELFDLAGRSPECPSCGGGSLRRVDDILDVWFDSSLSHYNVLTGRHMLERPCAVYLEATDQHRGWFGVSLISSCALDLDRPADNIITHGLIQDKHGKKMSKSLGNVISPLEIVDRMGADILRLWFASVDYTADFRADMAQLDDARQAYKKLRNTLRFMLGNLRGYDSHGFDPQTLDGLDRYSYLRFRRLQELCLREYRSFEFHRAYRELRNFAVIDLSNLLLDVRKDRLYCGDPEGAERRSTRSLLAHMLRELVKLLAPIVPFTAEDAWQNLPECLTEGVDSVHLALLEQVETTEAERAETEAWEPYLEVRSLAQKKLEEARESGLIRDSLQARVKMTVPPDMVQSARGEDWADFLIVSSAEVAAGDQPSVEVERARGGKCQRCWKWTPEVGTAPFAEDVCLRCSEVLAGMEED